MNVSPVYHGAPAESRTPVEDRTYAALEELGIPFDRVDDSYLKTPHKWDTASIQKFMFSMGPLSSLFDLCCYGVLWWAMGANTVQSAALFQ